MSWSTDGRFLLYGTTIRRQVTISGSYRWSAIVQPSVFLKTPSREAQGMFSPDGRWVVYQSDESG